jgi:hypothetical protein
MAFRVPPHRSNLAYNLNSTPPSSPQRPQNTRERRRKRRSPHGEDGNQRNKRQLEPNTGDGHQRNKRNRGCDEQGDPEDSQHDKEDGDEDWQDEENRQQRPPRRRSFKKCQYITAYMTQQKYTISNFLEDYCTQLFTHAKEGEAYFQAKHQLGMRKRYISQALSSSKVQETVNGARSGKIKIVQNDDLLELSTKQLLNQLDSLVGKQPFVAWDWKEDDLAASLQSIDIEAAVGVIREHAPAWERMLSEILQHPRSDQASTPNEGENQSLRRQYMIFMITTMVFRFRAQQRASLPVTQLSLYLESNGVKQRAISVLSKFGITLSPTQLRQRRNDIAEQAKVRSIPKPLYIS